MQEWARERSQSVFRGTERFFFLLFFFSLSTLRNKWLRASETERENKRESCCEMLSILAVLLPHLGHLFFGCHHCWHWQMTQPQSGGFGRQSPGTYSPQAKLVQNLVHLFAPLPRPFLLVSNLHSVQQLSHSSLCSWSLYFTPHLAAAHFSLPPLTNCPSFAPCPCLSVLFFFFLCVVFFPPSLSLSRAGRCSVIENHSLCRGKAEICESMMFQWRKGSLRIVLYWMCQTLKKMCRRKIKHWKC